MTHRLSIATLIVAAVSLVHADERFDSSHVGQIPLAEPGGPPNWTKSRTFRWEVSIR